MEIWVQMVLAERWRIYKTIRPHSLLGYKPPGPAAQLTGANEGHGKADSSECLPFFDGPGCGYWTNSMFLVFANIG
jgi:hypothetical protein